MSIHDDLNVRSFKSEQTKVSLNIMYTGHWLTTGINKRLRPLGLTEPQFNVLTLVYAARGEAVSAMGIKAGMIQRESNITRIVDRLLERGWVTRETCPKNRRKVDIRITGEGRKAFKEAHAVVTGFHNEMEGRLNPEEMDQLSELLDRLRNSPGNQS